MSLRLRDIIALCVVLLALTVQTSGMKINLERLLMKTRPQQQQHQLQQQKFHDSLNRIASRKRSGASDIIERPDDQNSDNPTGGKAQYLLHVNSLRWFISTCCLRCRNFTRLSH